MNYRLVNTNPEKGLAIMVDDFDNLTAFVNGQHYRVSDYRPVSGNGRQLREDTRAALDSMLHDALRIIEDWKKAEDAKLEAIKAAAMEAARKEATPAPKTFAEVLEEQLAHTLTSGIADDMAAKIYPVVEDMIMSKFGAVPVLHEIRIPGRPAFETTEILHRDFDRILSMLSDGEPVYLCGPAGTGKSYLAQQCAKALNVEYYDTSSVTDDVQIKGFVDANGRYHETPFYKAFTSGGVFLLDELDASIPETLVMLNNALANGYFSFPNGKAKVHDNFYCIAAGNTFGTGADNVYTGRYQLDAASMDRFALINVTYDERIEKAMALNDNALVEFVHAFRKAVNVCGITCLCTYRAIKRLAKFSAYMEKADALRIALVKGLAADDITMLVNRMENVNGNAWFIALANLAKNY